MLQTIEAEVDTNGTVRLLERVEITAPCRALVTILDDSINSSAKGNAAALLEFLRVNRLPASARLTVEEIEEQIAEAHTSWE